MPFAVITENDVSKWSDKTGSVYHFPKRYQVLLLPGTQVVYYKGRIKDKSYQSQRLSDLPHYFGTAQIGKVFSDKDSQKGDLFALIEGFKPFSQAVLAKLGHQGYYETIPTSRSGNYWRDGVRGISQNDYNSIVASAIYSLEGDIEPSIELELGEYESLSEGKKDMRYVTTYERMSKLRQQAIAIHGTTCFGCSFNFGQYYGAEAEGFIHIHHIHPLSEGDGEQLIDPALDLIPLCPNCHAMIHMNKKKTLSLAELRALIMTAEARA
ncbi:HNH endonuclease [Edwardsiella tarda]